MSRRPKNVEENITVTPRPVAEQSISPEDQAELEAQEEAQLQAGEWLSEFQARFTDQPVKILVEKYDDMGDWAMCKRYPLANFDPESVKIEYGAGKYRCTLFDPTGRWVKGGRTYFKFAESLIKEAPARAENPLENPIVAMIMKASESQNALLLGLMQSMIAAQGAAGPKGTLLPEIVETMKSLNSMSPKDKPMESLKETLGLMKLVKEVTGDSDGDNKGGLLSDLKEVIEVLPLLKEHMASLKAPAPQIAPGKENEMDPLSKKVIELVPKFIGGARANAPAIEWGSYLLDVFDAEILPILLPVMKTKFGALVKDEDDAYDIVLRLAKDPAERDNIFVNIPPLAPYKPWVLQVIDEAVKLAETPDAEVTSAPVKVDGGGSGILTAVAAGKENSASLAG